LGDDFVGGFESLDGSGAEPGGGDREKENPKNFSKGGRKAGKLTAKIKANNAKRG